MMKPFKCLRLQNGLQIKFVDLSNRYFGDYHHLRIDVQIICEVPDNLPVDENRSVGQQVHTSAGRQLLVKRRLEKMAVASADLERERDGLVEGFLASTRGYLQKPETLRALMEAELNKRRSPRRYGA